MKIKYWLMMLAVGTVFLSTSCNKYLDEMPDNRSELDTPEKMRQMLVYAYPEYPPILLWEFMSDNYEDNGAQFDPVADMLTQAYTFREINTLFQDSPNYVWQTCYSAISHANHVLEALETLPNPSAYDHLKGEALIARAYSHFLLAQTFCQGYAPRTKDGLGIPYALVPETVAIVEYERGTLEETYQNIENDIRTGLPLIKDYNTETPKYHFGTAASYAFAAQFYLFYGNQQNDEEAQRYYQLSIDYANRVLGGDNPELRQMMDLRALTGYEDQRNLWISTTHPSNLLAISGNTYFGYYYATTNRFGISDWKLNNELMSSIFPYGGQLDGWQTIWHQHSGRNEFHPKAFHTWLITNAGSNTGLIKGTTIPFTKEKTLLYRAEAYALLGNLEAAAHDLNLWYVAGGGEAVAGADEIISFYEQYVPNYLKKTIHADGYLSRLDSRQTTMIHAVLHARRVEGVHEGLSFLDYKRYGFMYYHNYWTDRVNQQYLLVDDFDDFLAVQLPSTVTAAGLRANPRPGDPEGLNHTEKLPVPSVPDQYRY